MESICPTDFIVSFNYKEFEPLDFNLNNFESNLISVIAYHVFTVIGLDADLKNSTFSDRLFKAHKDKFVECFIAE